MTWTCAAIDHALAIFPNGKIGPCCQIKADYLKPLDAVAFQDRFADLKTEFPPDACFKCISAEHQKIPSYRETMNNRLLMDRPGIQFLDIRNSNVCNLKCRYCGPHFSNIWAKELNIYPEIKHTDYRQYKKMMITPELREMYFTGGEPLINAEHWDLLEEIVELGFSHHINLQYNTNLTTIKFKDKDIIETWKKFKSVELQVSMDSTESIAEYIRSGLDWKKFNDNLNRILKSTDSTNIKVSICCVVSILNIWSIDKIFNYADSLGIEISLIILDGPDYLALDVIPDEFTELALCSIDKIKTRISPDMFNVLRSKIMNNINQLLFPHALNHILLLDNLRKENLFDLLPFTQIAIEKILKNHEYE